MFTKMKKHPVFYLSLIGSVLSVLIFLLATTDLFPGLSAWIGTLGLAIFGPLALLKDPSESRKTSSN